LPPNDPVEALWRAAPAPALRVWADAPGPAPRVDEAGPASRADAPGPAPRAEPNEAARRLAVAASLGETGWAGLAAAARAQPAGQRFVHRPGVGDFALRCTPLPLPDGLLVWIEPGPPGVAERLLADQLHLVQEFGRMGFFVRDLATNEGHWDEHVYRIFGLDPALTTPRFDDAVARCVHPEDREALMRFHATLLGHAGRHGNRFRIVRPDGEVRHLHSVFEVRPGAAGGPGTMVGVLVDDTDAVRRDQAQQRDVRHLERAAQLAGLSVRRLDLLTQRIRFNAAGFDVIGMRPDAEGIPVEYMRSTIHPDDRAAVEAAAEAAAREHRVIDVLARYRNRDGSWRTLLTRRVAERDEQGRALALTGVSLDLTQQAQVQAEAAAAAARTALAVEALGVGFWSLDGQTGVVHWDEQMFRIHQREPERGAPRRDEWIEEHVHPQDQAWMAERQARANARWEPVNDAVFRVPDEGGRERWVQSWARRTHRDGGRVCFGMHLDVTERVHAEQRAVRERERTQFALAAAEVGVWERDASGRLVFWNEAMFRIRGFDPADPRPLDELASLARDPGGRDDSRDWLLADRADGEPYRRERRIRHAGGGWRWIVSQGRILRGADGRRLGMAGINLDVTERRAAEQLRVDKELAEQGQREMGAFLGRVSHELRTPMNAIVGFTRLMADDPLERPSPGQRRRIEHVQRAGAQLLEMIDGLLDIVHVEQGGAHEGDESAWAPAVASALARLGPMAERRGVRIERDGATSLPGAVRCSPPRLVALLVPLLAHAVGRCPGGGALHLRVEDEDAAGTTMSVLVVRDPGAAPSRDERALLLESIGGAPGSESGGFAPGRETGGFAPGGETGGFAPLGPGLAQRLVAALGGHVVIAAAAGGGGELRIALPAAVAAATGGGAAAPAAGREGGAPLVVLCVEDNPVNQLLVREMLALRNDVELHAAEDAASALAMAARVTPELVLLDLQLPDRPGVEVLHALRADPATARARVVALTANAMPADMAAMRAAGFDDFWTKPIDLGRFQAGIDEAVAAVRARRAA
jgi:PAS domain S-box-containing protein